MMLISRRSFTGRVSSLAELEADAPPIIAELDAEKPLVELPANIISIRPKVTHTAPSPAELEA